MAQKNYEVQISTIHSNNTLRMKVLKYKTVIVWLRIRLLIFMRLTGERENLMNDGFLQLEHTLNMASLKLLKVSTKIVLKKST